MNMLWWWSALGYLFYHNLHNYIKIVPLILFSTSSLLIDPETKKKIKKKDVKFVKNDMLLIIPLNKFLKAFFFEAELPLLK